jgi:hypothetical protein
MRSFKAELRFLYPIATMPEPGGGIISGDGLQRFRDSPIQGFGGA